MLKSIREGIERHEPARERRTNLTGGPVLMHPYPGSLPDPYRREYWDTEIRYVIFSYDTPIAWLRYGGTWLPTDGTWRFPPVNYSLTTTAHQDIVRAALQSVLGDGWRDRIDSSGEEIRMRKGYGPNGRYGSRGDGTF